MFDLGKFLRDPLGLQRQKPVITASVPTLPNSPARARQQQQLQAQSQPNFANQVQHNVEQAARFVAPVGISGLNMANLIGSGFNQSEATKRNQDLLHSIGLSKPLSHDLADSSITPEKVVKPIVDDINNYGKQANVASQARRNGANPIQMAYGDDAAKVFHINPQKSKEAIRTAEAQTQTRLAPVDERTRLAVSNFGLVYAPGKPAVAASGKVAEKGAQIVNEARPSVLAAKHPAVAGFDDQYSQLAHKFDNTPDPDARRAISQAMAENRAQRLQTRRSIERQIGQGGYLGIPSKDDILGSKPAQFFFGDKKIVQDATQNNMAARQMANTEQAPQMNLNPDLARLAPDTQRPAEIAALSRELPEKTISTSPSNHQANLPEQAPQRTPLPTESAMQDAAGSPGDLRTRGFIDTIKNDVNTPTEVKDRISSLYQVRNTKELQLKAANLVKSHPDIAQSIANSGSGDIEQMLGSELIKHHNAHGNIENSIAIAQEVARKATENGRASQALSAYSKLTPEGILRFTQQEINRFNVANKLSPAKQLKLSAEKAQELVDKSTAIQAMPEGRAKDIATQDMLNTIQEIMPAGWVKKVSTLQTIGQLLNPKTALRNVIGNSMFSGLDNVSQVGAAGIDKLTSAITGSERTTALPNLRTQVGAAFKHGKEAVEEINKGVNLGPETQFELSDVPVFKSKFLRAIEKTLSYELRVSDRAAYGAAFDDTLKGLMKVNKVAKPTQEMLDLAHANGLYKTFQDNSKAAQLFSEMKGALNRLGFEKNGQRWGLGDLILKYPKTPGNIIARGLDYSPAGIMKGLYQIVKPAITKQPFDQHTFANSIARGTVGTGGLIGAGAVLGSLGIITEKPSSDTDTRNLQKASGQGGYQINTSALVRFFTSGFNKDAAKIQRGDTLVSYDWAQPLSIPLSAGAAMGKGDNAVDGATSTIENLTSGLNTLVEQPLVSGLNTFFGNVKNKGVIGSLGETAKSAPASFIPTLFNQGRQLQDNTSRSTYDPNDFSESINKVTNRLPFASNGLPAQVDPLGNSKENYQDSSNNIFNVMFNPAFVTKYNPNAAAKLPLDILANSGETKQMPRTTATNQKVSGENIQLTSQQNHDFQEYVGKHTSDYYNQLMNDKAFMAKPDSEKAKIMSSGLSDISKAGKIAILGDSSKATAAQKALAAGGTNYKTSSGGVQISGNLDGSYKEILDKYNSLDSAGKTKLFSTQNDAEYKYEKAKYENDKANGKLSKIQDLRASKALKKQEVGSQVSKDARDLYGMSKKEVLAYISSDPNGKKLADELNKYDQALYDAGLISTKKFRNGFGTATKGSRKKKGGKGKKGSSFKLPSTSIANEAAESTYKSLSKLLAGTTAKKANIPRTGRGKANVRKITVKA